ncbi:MAG: DUF4333 domain-containing protein [Nocardioides sp.]
MRRFVVIPVLLTLALGGCSSSQSVAQSDVEDQISTQLEAQVGAKPDSVKCPGDLDAKVDTKMTCKLSVDGTEYDVTVTVTSVKDGKANFDIQVADQPN